MFFAGQVAPLILKALEATPLVGKWANSDKARRDSEFLARVASKRGRLSGLPFTHEGGRDGTEPGLTPMARCFVRWPA